MVNVKNLVSKVNKNRFGWYIIYEVKGKAFVTQYYDSETKAWEEVERKVNG